MESAGNQIGKPLVLVEECNKARVVILNRPKQLNALSHSMVEYLKQLYELWKSDSQVSLIIIKGAGRAFCAGGDVVALYHSSNAGQFTLAREFFNTSYKLTYLIGTCKKPHVALLDGIVMGGGAGISIHGPIRVVTENTVFSMPESALGIHPDVGTSYFLSRLPGCLGEYLGLTGAKLDGADLLSCGLATHFVPSKSLWELEKALKRSSTRGIGDVSTLIEEFAVKVNLQDNSPLHRSAEISRCFSKATVEEILEALNLEGDSCNGWYKASAKSLRGASPLSLKIALRLIRQSRHQTLVGCFIQEYRLSLRCVCQSVSTNFYEGVRAFLVDKDMNPKWSPCTLQLATPKIVDQFFSPLKEDEGQELNLSFLCDCHTSVKGLARL